MLVVLTGLLHYCMLLNCESFIHVDTATAMATMSVGEIFWKGTVGDDAVLVVLTGPLHYCILLNCDSFVM